MYIGTIAKRYATALLSFSLEQGVEDQVYEEVLRLIAVYRTTDEMRTVMADPLLGRDRKESVLISAAQTETGGDVSDVWRKFVTLVLSHRRESIMLFIAHSFITLYRSHKHISIVRLTTARRTSEAVRLRLKEMVEEHSRESSEVILSEDVNPELIGGFIFQLDDYRLDVSVRHEFETIKKHFIDKNKRIV